MVNVPCNCIKIARAGKIQRVQARRGWTFPWHSSGACDLHDDFGVSFRKDAIATGRAICNDGTQIKKRGNMHGTSIFALGADDSIYHTYSTFARGGEPLIGAYSWLDLTPEGHSETGTMSWVRVHDQYPAA
jgi:predicted dithiol-disulfide oxidoreductase (DUF899 family)